MKRTKVCILLITVLGGFTLASGDAQTFTSPSEANASHLVGPSNVNYAGLEKDILLYANTRYQVTQTGSAVLNLSSLFDARYDPSYTTGAPSDADPTVILIENLPAVHVQRQTWVGWTTRYWPAKKFKIEGYNTWTSKPVGWITLADVDNNGSEFYITPLPSGIYTKLRFTIYQGCSGAQGKFGISEIFFLHNEAAQAYDGLMVKYQPNGNVLIGKTSQSNTSYKLDVNGDIRANKVVVNASGADYVFDSAYHLPPLDSLNNYIKACHHLPGILSAGKMKNEGMDVGETQTALLKKVEELTLYVIELNKKISQLETINRELLQKLNLATSPYSHK